jgi:integrase
VKFIFSSHTFQGEALLRVEKYLTHNLSTAFRSPSAHTATPSASFQQPQQKKPFKSLKSELDKYTKAKTGEVGEREILTINRCVNAYLNSTKSLSANEARRRLLMALKVQHPPETVTSKRTRRFSNGLQLARMMRFETHLRGCVKEITAPMDRRPAYTLNDLKRLHIALHGVKDWKRWIILIGRYSGMRQNEICQLYHNDVMKVDGVWCFRVDNLNPNQTLKTDSSRRFVPINSQLLTLGLLDFIKERKGHLFPELTLHLGSYGHYFSRWFTRFRGKHSLPEYHSLRHYAATTFKQNGFPEQFASQVLGHSNATITYNRYGKGIAVRTLVELIEVL